jgi:hypothetical protein
MKQVEVLHSSYHRVDAGKEHSLPSLYLGSISGSPSPSLSPR